jgi:type III pantothenate kinase
MKASHSSIWAIDIGNSRVSVGRMVDGKLVLSKTFENKGIPKISRFIGRSGKKHPKICVICSVVPESEQKIVSGLKHLQSIQIYRIGRQIEVPVRIKYRSPKKLGNDRKVNVFGALEHAKPPFVIFDFGTATTVDFVSQDGVFEGGWILPGIEMGLQALHEGTALLPRIRKMGPVRTFLGQDTLTGMLGGALQGCGAMVDGLTDRLRRRYGRNVKTIATGGAVDIIRGYCSGFDIVDRELTLRSIGWIYEYWRKRSKAETRDE